MKKISLRLASFVLAVIACASVGFSYRGVVTDPMIGSANQSSLSVERVILSDSATVLDAVVHYRPGWWVRLAGSSAIVADGVEYPLVSARGVKMDERITLPDSGVVRFSLVFPPVPDSVRSLDFTEGTPSGWKIWDIDLTGEVGHNVNRAAVPARLQVNARGDVLPEPLVAFGDSATVRVHILGYRPGMGSNLVYGLNTLHGQVGTDRPVPIDSLGVAEVRWSLSAPATFFTLFTDGDIRLNSRALVEPGETLDVYVDSHVSGIDNMHARVGQGDYRMPEGFTSFYTGGRYRDIFPNSRGADYHGMQLRNGKFGDYRMDGNAYTDYIISCFKAISRDIAADSLLSPMGRQYWMAKLQAELIQAAETAPFLLGMNYRHSKQNWEAPVPEDSVNVVLSAGNIREIAALIDFNNPGMMFIDDLSLFRSDPSFWTNAGVDPGIMKTLRAYREAWSAAESAVLTDSLADVLRSLEPVMADEVVAHNKAVAARLASLDRSLVSATPDVPVDSIFEAIVAPHKGKVVMVDLWNTWCAPCRAALAENEPEKDGELSSPDIVWIYLADESSPYPVYLSKIKEIRGIHYYLTDEQMQALRSRFEVDGIPYYILVDRSGKAVGRPDLRDHSAFKRAILSALTH